MKMIMIINQNNDFVKNDDNNLEMPERIQKDTREQLNNNDPIQQFIDEKIEKNRKYCCIGSSELYKEYLSFFEFDNNRNNKKQNNKFQNNKKIFK